MIQMRHYPDRTLRIPSEELSEQWAPLGYSEYCIRVQGMWLGAVGVIEIKHADDIEWPDENDDLSEWSRPFEV